MGIIYMERKFEFMHKGYPYGTDILYVYCDKCGSFSITTYLGIRKWLLIIGVIGILIAGGFATFKPGALYFDGIVISLVICVVAQNSVGGYKL